MTHLFSMLRFVLLVLIGTTLFCTVERMAGGGTIETTNGRVTGAVVYPDGNPAPGSQVKLVPENYDPVKGAAVIPVDTTDDSGRYVFTGVSYGVYTIQSVQCIDRTRAIEFGIGLAQSSLSLAPITLRQPGAIKILLPGGANAINGHAFVPGTDIGASSNGGQSILLDSVPAGTLPSVKYAANNDTAFSVIRYNVHVSPGATDTLVNPSWRYARSILLNTTPSGADVTANVTGFPLLVRLTRSNFDFAQAQTGGGDLRFTKSDNSPLPCQIERFDPAAGLAEAWVKVDTVFGNDNTHAITMYWGNPGATDSSNGAAVFDTGAGFMGVWHLSDGNAGQALDATGNGYNGVAYNMAAQSGPSGIIGTGREFRGDSSYITMPVTSGSKLNFPQNGVYSLSAWVYADTLDSLYQAIISKGDEQYNLEILNNDWEFAEYENKTGWDMAQSPLPATPRQWVLVAGVRSQADQYLYVNGLCVDSVGTVLGNGFSRSAAYDLMIGRTNGITMPGFPYYFHGMLDEIRIQGRALGPDWIKLCYMNQKMPDALLQ